MSLRAAVLMAGIAVATAAFAGGKEPRVCADPAHPCAGFKPHDLSFPLPENAMASGEPRSAPFFAVILKTVKRCAASEAERLEIQALFPGQKVFATRFECDDDVENNVTYTNTDRKVGFIAVYGGETRAVAGEVLARAKTMKRFPGANLRAMQVIYALP